MTTISIHSIGCAVPPFQYSQEEICQYMLDKTSNIKEKNFIQRIYSLSGIEQRHSILPDFYRDTKKVLFKDQHLSPSTKQRNALYTIESKKMGEEASQKAISSSPFEASEITHIITVSCTGFYNPGLDLHLIAALGIPSTAKRYHLGFMGCYAAIPALSMAQQFCEANPDAVVLVVCVEICSLHFQEGRKADTIVANALFADGSAAALVSAKPAYSTSIQINQFVSSIIPEGHDDMAWIIGDHGFEMTLSSYIPSILKANMLDLWKTSSLFESLEEVDLWAIHPGGRAILDAAEESFNIQTDQLAPSRSILQKFGNMSSATILFVLNEIWDHPRSHICAMAFGPGLTLELAQMKLIPQKQFTENKQRSLCVK